MNFLRPYGAVVVGDVVYAPGGICGPRVQRDYQLVVVHTGELDLKLDGKPIHLGAGEAILLSPRHREYFAFSKTEETRHSWCAIRPGSIPRKLRRHLSGPSGPIPFVGRMNVLLEWSAAISEVAEARLQDGFYLGVGLALLCDFALAAQRDVRGHSGSEALARMENFIRSAYAEPLTLTDLARKAGVSSQHLLKLCRARAMATPTQQLYRKRVEIAAELLLGTGLSVGEISERCGFANAFHFSRKFRQTYGKSPLAWRKQLWTTKKRGGVKVRP